MQDVLFDGKSFLIKCLFIELCVFVNTGLRAYAYSPYIGIFLIYPGTGNETYLFNSSLEFLKVFYIRNGKFKIVAIVCEFTGKRLKLNYMRPSLL